MKKTFGNIENCNTFAMRNILTGGRLVRLSLIVSGFFYAQNLPISVQNPRVGVLMHPQPVRCYATGKAVPYFIFTATFLLQTFFCNA